MAKGGFLCRHCIEQIEAAENTKVSSASVTPEQVRGRGHLWPQEVRAFLHQLYLARQAAPGQALTVEMSPQDMEALVAIMAHYTLALEMGLLDEYSQAFSTSRQLRCRKEEK